MNGSEGSELQHQEDIASVYAVGIDENQRQIKQLSRLIRVAWLALAAAPIVAGLTAFITRVLQDVSICGFGFMSPPLIS